MYNLNVNHPLIPNSNEYMLEQKVISIHSEDRDVLKWPSPSEFEIELPSDYLNITSIRLGNYTFPSNYNTFSAIRGNILITFQFTDIYNPADYQYYNQIQDIIFKALQSKNNQDIIVTITEGFYNPQQMANELTNRFNDIITQIVINYINNDSGLSPDEILSVTSEFLKQGGYTHFIIVYNEVSQTLFFGNKSSQFVITNDSAIYVLDPSKIINPCLMIPNKSFENFGLPSYLGFTRCPVLSTKNNPRFFGDYPRFYYGDILVPGDSGFWITPDTDYKNTHVYYLQAPSKINLMGDAYFYMEIEGLNNIDETLPYVINNYTLTSNMNLGVYNSAFAKIGVTTTPVSQWFDTNQEAVKIFNPPLERLRRIKLKIRYHDGLLVEFGKFNYSFNLVLTLLRPQKIRGSTVYDPLAGVSSSFGVIRKS